MAKETPKKEDLSFLENAEDQGYDGISVEDIAIPFLKILQLLSPQCDEDRSEYVTGAKPGIFCNSVTGRLYGTEIQVIPLKYKKMWLEWKPDRGGLVGRHEPNSIQVDKSDFSKWKNAAGNTIQDSRVFYCLIVNHLDEGPILFPLSSSGIKHAKNWNTQILNTRLPNGKRAPFFSSAWTLETVKIVDGPNTWYQIGDKGTLVTRDRFVSAKEYSEYVAPGIEALAALNQSADFTQIEDQSGGDAESTEY